MKTLLLTCLLLLTSCGWHLAGTVSDSAAHRIQTTSLKLVKRTNNRELHIAFEQAFLQYGIRNDSDAELVLTLHNVKHERRPLSYSSTGNPVQYQLDTYVEFSYQTKSGEFIVNTRTASAHRQYDFQATAVIAKKQEERELIKEMYTELANRILAQAK